MAKTLQLNENGADFKILTPINDPPSVRKQNTRGTSAGSINRRTEMNMAADASET